MTHGMIEWSKSSKTGNCEGDMFKCHLFASLKPVYVGSKEIWLCGKCIAKVKYFLRTNPGKKRHIHF